VLGRRSVYSWLTKSCRAKQSIQIPKSSKTSSKELSKSPYEKHAYYLTQKAVLKRNISQGQNDSAVLALSRLAEKVGVNSDDIMQVLGSVRPTKRALREIGLLLRKVQVLRGTRFLASSGLLNGFIYFCGRAGRFDLAKKAFNVISLVPGTRSQQKQSQSALASLSLAAAMCNKDALSRMLLAEYYKMCRDDFKELRTELWQAVGVGNHVEMFHLLDLLTEKKNKEIPRELRQRIFRLATHAQGVRGAMRAYARLVLLPEGNPLEKHRDVLDLTDIVLTDCIESEVNQADVILKMFMTLDIPKAVRAEFFERMIKAQENALEEERLTRMLSIAKAARSLNDFITDHSMSVIAAEALKCKDLSLALAVHAEQLQRNQELDSSHYAGFIELALSLNEDQLAGTLLREFRERSMQVDTRMTNVLLYYASRLSTPLQAYNTLRGLLGRSTSVSQQFVEDVVKRTSSAGLVAETEFMWRQLCKQFPASKIEPDVVTAVFQMYANLHDCKAAEAALNWCKEVGVEVSKQAYSILQQLYFVNGNMTRAKELREECTLAFADRERQRLRIMNEAKERGTVQVELRKERSQMLRRSRLLLVRDQAELGLLRGKALYKDQLDIVREKEMEDAALHHEVQTDKQ